MCKKKMLTVMLSGLGVFGLGFGLGRFFVFCFCFGLAFCFWFFFKSGFLDNPGYLVTHSVDQADLKLIDMPASASQVLGLQVCTTTALWFQALLITRLLDSLLLWIWRGGFGLLKGSHYVALATLALAASAPLSAGVKGLGCHDLRHGLL